MIPGSQKLKIRSVSPGNRGCSAYGTLHTDLEPPSVVLRAVPIVALSSRLLQGSETQRHLFDFLLMP